MVLCDPLPPPLLHYVTPLPCVIETDSGTAVSRIEHLSEDECVSFSSHIESSDLPSPLGEFSLRMHAIYSRESYL